MWNIKRYLVPVLEELGVDLVLQGHDHNYIRSYPIQNSLPNIASVINNNTLISSTDDGIVYLLTRNSGEKTYPVASTSSRPWIDVIWNHSSVSALPEATMFAVITAYDDRLAVKACTVGGFFCDEFTIIEGDKASFQKRGFSAPMIEEEDDFIEPEDEEEAWPEAA
jgi:hypothetical protein